MEGHFLAMTNPVLGDEGTSCKYVAPRVAIAGSCDFGITGHASRV